MQKTYLHVDLDAFFASVEQRDHPEYRGKPLVVGGLPQDRRSVVSTASYEARKYGIHAAMPIFQAVRLCPDAFFVRGNHQKYEEVSSAIMGIFHNYSPTVLQMSIDEAFIDITGTEKLFGPPEVVAKKIKQEVFEKTNLTVSIGISQSMYVAKIASGYKKPNGLTIIPPGKEEEFMLSLPLEKLWGVGEKTQKHLKDAGLNTIPAIHEKSEKLLVSIFGSTGSYIYNAVRGNMDLQFGTEAKYHSISSETTFEFDLTSPDSIEYSIMALCSNVNYRMHKENVRTRTVAVKIRYEDFSTVSIQETSEYAVSNEDDLYERCKRLFYKKYEKGRGVRLLGISADKVESKSIPIQQNLFEDKNTKKARLEEAIYAMEDKNPKLKMHKARLLKKD